MGSENFPGQQEPRLEWDPFHDPLYHHDAATGVTTAYVVRDDVLHPLKPRSEPDPLTPISLANYLVPDIEEPPIMTFAEADEQGLRLPTWTIKGTTSHLSSKELLRIANERLMERDDPEVQMYDFGFHS